MSLASEKSEGGEKKKNLHGKRPKAKKRTKPLWMHDYVVKSENFTSRADILRLGSSKRGRGVSIACFAMAGVEL